jgi:hypothetical protein
VTFSALAALSVRASGAEPPWMYAAGTRSSGEVVTDFQIWWRGSEAVVEERLKGALVWQSSCRAGTLGELNHQTMSAVVRRELIPEQCFKWATGSSLGVALAVEDSGLRLVAAVQDESGLVETYADKEGVVRVAIIRPWGVPKLFMSPEGQKTEWVYQALRQTGDQPPALEIPTAWTTESYVDLAIGEASRVSGLGNLPERIGDLVFKVAFEYRPAAGSRPTLYVLWTAAERELQLVRGAGLVDPAELGTHEEGGAVVFKRQIGDDYLQVIAPSKVELDRLLAALKIED